jgi:hypothetical protein
MPRSAAAHSKHFPAARPFGLGTAATSFCDGNRQDRLVAQTNSFAFMLSGWTLRRGDPFSFQAARITSK